MAALRTRQSSESGRLKRKCWQSHCDPGTEDGVSAQRLSEALDDDVGQIDLQYLSAPISPAQCEAERMQMRAWIGIAVVVAIGLIWSVAAMSKLVPMASTEMTSAATSLHEARAE